jgi:hypothetical protein
MELRTREDQLAQVRAWLDEAQEELVTTQAALQEREGECRRVGVQLAAMQAVAASAQVGRWLLLQRAGAKPSHHTISCGAGIGCPQPHAYRLHSLFSFQFSHASPPPAPSCPPPRLQESASSLEGRDAALLQQNMELVAQLQSVTAAYEEMQAQLAAAAATNGATAALAAFGTTLERPVSGGWAAGGGRGLGDSAALLVVWKLGRRHCW